MGGKRLQKITGILSEHIRLSVYHVMFLFSVKRVASVSSPNLTLQIPQLPRHSPIFSLSISHSPVLFHLFCSTSTFIFPVQKPLTNQTATHLSRPSCPILRLSFSYPVIQLSFPWHVLSHSLSLSPFCRWVSPVRSPFTNIFTCPTSLLLGHLPLPRVPIRGDNWWDKGN